MSASCDYENEMLLAGKTQLAIVCYEYSLVVPLRGKISNDLNYYLFFLWKSKLASFGSSQVEIFTYMIYCL